MTVSSKDDDPVHQVREAQSPPWLTGWTFRKTHSIGASVGAGTNYQIKLAVQFGTGPDSGENVFCDSKCQDDFDDIRFTGDDGTTELHYWRQVYNLSSRAVFWVEVQSDLSTAVSQMFIYYGNDAVSTTSNGSETFSFFDDFNGPAGSSPDTSKWSIIPGVGVKLDGNGSIRFDDADSENRGGVNGPYFGPYGVSVLSRVWSSSSLIRNNVWDAFWDGSGDAVTCWAGNTANNVHYVSGNNYSETYTDVTLELNQWHVYEAKWLVDHAYWYVDDTQTAHHTTNIPDASCYVTMGEGTGSPGTYFLADWVAVRKCIAAEPSHLAWGSEENSGPSSWLSGWSFRKSHTIDGSAGAGTDYQIRIIAHYGSGNDSGSDVYFDYKSQPDFDDIRFTDDDGLTLLDHAREDVLVADYAVFWVEVADNLNFTVSIYVYYGKADAESADNEDATFVFFDDFEDNNLNKWSYIDSADFRTGTSRVKQGNYSMYYDGDGWTSAGKNFVSGPASFLFHVWVQADDVLRGSPQDVLYADNLSGVRHCHIYEGFLTYDHTPNYAWPNNSAVYSDVWYELEVGFDMDAAKSRAWKNDAYCGETDLLEVYHRWTVNNTRLSTYRFSGWMGYQFWIDQLFIRKWQVSEPTHGIWGGQVSAEPWLSGWDFRKIHAINGSDGAGTDYQTRMVAHFGSGTDSGQDIYCNNQSQPDFDDLRFTDEDGLTLLHYWTEEVAVFDQAIFWVRIGDNLNSTVEIYVYYGNDACSSISNGSATFVFFDDFESGVLSPTKWEDPGDWQIVDTNIKHGSYAAYCVADAPELTLWCNLTSKQLNYGFMLHVWARFGGLLGSAGYPELFRDSDGQQVYSVMVYNGQYCYAQGGPTPTPWPANNTISSNTYYRTELGFDFHNNRQRCWKSGSYMGEIDLKDISGGSVTEIIYYGPGAGYHSGEDAWLDDCCIRKWIPEEPRHGAWGTEENRTVIDDSSPVLQGLPDRDIEAGSLGNALVWIPADASPSSYELFVDGSNTRTGSWNHTGEAIVVSLDGLPLGIHNYTLVVYDYGMKSATDTVIVAVVDTTPPVLENLADREIEGGTMGRRIVWTPEDVCPSTFELYIDGSQNRTGLWNYTGEAIAVDLNALLLVVHNYTLVVYDSSMSSAYDTVIVTVVDTTPPVINHPLDIRMSEADTGQSIVWTPSDLYPASWEVRLNGTVIASGAWNSTGEDLVVSLDGLSLGTHVYSITVTDMGGNTEHDVVAVTVERVPDWWEVFGPFGSVTVIITIGSLAVIVVFSALICRMEK